MKCPVCNKEDLLMACMDADAGACAVCTMKFFGGARITPERIKTVRTELGLADGEFLELDHGAEAARILGRT